MNVQKLFIVLLALSFGSFTPPAFAKDITIKAEQIKVFQLAEPDRIKFGQLAFVGGLVLTSKNDNFGGLSGMRIVGDTLYAVTDKGHFLTAKITREVGKLSGLENATLTRLRGRDGKKIKKKRNADAESLEIVGSQYLVGFERNDRIEVFNRKGNKLVGDGRAKTTNLKKFDFPNNKGPEAIAHIPNSEKLLAFAEYAPNNENLHQAFIVEGKEITPFFVTLTPGYSLTDATFLPNGELIMLERFYTPVTGSAMRIRTFDISNLKEGAVFDGKIISEATSEMQIDNMEGISVSTNAAGETLVAIISDDNFSRSQRTLLLEFKLSN